MSGDGVIFTREEARRTEAAVKHFERSQRGILAPALKKVRASGGVTTTGDGGSGGGGLATNNCCDTIYQAGSVDLDGLEWATDYTITLAAPIGTVTVTDQGSGTWESDAIEVSCTVDEVTVTDEYTVTMTATGNAPGEVIVTVALTLGGGYGGAAGCCETTEAGFAWKYVNCCIVDPLAGWSMTRDPSGFSGKECEIGGCEICVTPSPKYTLVNCDCTNPLFSSFNAPLEYNLTFSGFDGSWTENLSTYDLTKINGTHNVTVRSNKNWDTCEIASTVSCKAWHDITEDLTIDGTVPELLLLKISDCTWRLAARVTQWRSVDASVASIIAEYLSEEYTPTSKTDLENWVQSGKTLNLCRQIPDTGTVGSLSIAPVI